MHYEKFADDSVKCIEDEIPFELPEGWAWARIFSITEDLPYGTAKKSTQTGLVAVLRMGNIQSGEIDYSDLVYSSDIDDIEKYTLVKNDLLFNRTNSAEWVGKTAIYRGNIPAIYAGYLIRVRSFIVSEYLNVVMNSGYAKDYCNSVKTDGVNQSNINAQKLGNFLVPIPSLAEQKRISSSILEFIPRISMIQEEKEHIADLILQTKSKILDLAIRGQLVPQNPDDEPASVLLERIRAEKEELIKKGKIKRDKKESIIFKGEDNSYYEIVSDKPNILGNSNLFDLPDNWCWCRVRSIADVKGGKRLPKGCSFSDIPTDHAYIRVTDMKNQTVNTTDLKYISDEVYEQIKSYIISKNDLYITIAGTIGVVGEIPDELDNMNLTENAAKLCDIKIDKKYLCYILSSRFVQNQFQEKTHQVAMPKLALERILTTIIPIPPYKEQVLIVKKLEGTLCKMNTIENSI